MHDGRPSKLVKEARRMQEEKAFRIKFNLEAEFPEDYEGEQDDYAWLQEWERQIKPDVLKLIFDALRRHSSWKVHVRNRGLSPLDEIEIVMVRSFAKDLSQLN
jgi:DNA modification methylase